MLKQLVLVGRYLPDSDVGTTILHIGDLANGTADTIERAMLYNTCLTKHFKLPNYMLLVVMVHQ